MTHTLVQIIIDDDLQETNNLDWHLVDPGNPCGTAALCTGEFFGDGESAVSYKTKTVKRGGITCKKCMDVLLSYKAIRQ